MGGKRNVEEGKALSGSASVYLSHSTLPILSSEPQPLMPSQNRRVILCLRETSPAPHLQYRRTVALDRPSVAFKRWTRSGSDCEASRTDKTWRRLHDDDILSCSLRSLMFNHRFSERQTIAVVRGLGQHHRDKYIRRTMILHGRYVCRICKK